MQEKLPSDSILIALLIQHAAWCLTLIQVENEGGFAFVLVFGKAYTSQVLPFGERVMYKYTAVPTGNLDQRWGHGIWVGKAPMTDEHTILTENVVQKARSLHRVPLEERFVISEMKKSARISLERQGGELESDDCDATGPRFIWTSTCELDEKGRGKAWCNVWLQWRFRFGTAHRSVSGAIGKGIGGRESECRSSRSGAGPIAVLATELQRPIPAAQQEPASSSSGLATPMPTQNLQNEQMDSPKELGAQDCRERKGARPSETPSNDIFGRPVVKARPASPPTIVPTAEGSGTVVFSAPVSSSKGEMTIGGLYVIDGIDVVATLVPEVAWQFEAAETCTTETQLQDREQESFAVVNHEDPSTSEAFEAYDAITSESLHSEEVRKGRAEEVRELDEFEVKMEVDESEMRATPGQEHRCQNGWGCERIQTAQQYYVGCVPRKSTLVNRDLITFAATLCEILATDFELGSELQAQTSDCVDDHCCI